MDLEFLLIVSGRFGSICASQQIPLSGVAARGCVCTRGWVLGCLLCVMLIGWYVGGILVVYWMSCFVIWSLLLCGVGG